MTSPYDIPAGFHYLGIPWEQIMGTGELMQAQEDKQKANLLEVGKKRIKYLPIDTQDALGEQQKVQGTVSDLFNKYSKEGFRNAGDDIIRAKQAMEDTTGPFSKWNAIENRYNEYADAMKEIDSRKDLNEAQRLYYKDQLNKQAGYPTKLDSSLIPTQANSLGYSDISSTYQHITPGDQYEHENKNEWIDKRLAKIASDKRYIPQGWVGTPFEFVKGFREGTIKGLDYDKITQALIQEAASDPNLIKSSQVEALYGGYNTNEGKFYNTAEVKDKSGKVIGHKYVPNTNTLLGSSIHGAAGGAAYQEEDFNTKFVTDELGLHAGKKKIDEMPEILAKEVQAPSYGTSVDSNKSLQSAKETGKQALNIELQKILEKTPNLKSKYGYASSTGFIEQVMTKDPDTRNAIIKDIIANSPRDRVGLIKGLLQQQQDVEQRDKEAIDYAKEQIKLSGNKKDQAQFESDTKLLEAVKGLDLSNPQSIINEAKRLGVEYSNAALDKDPRVSNPMNERNLARVLDAKGFKVSNWADPYQWTSRLYLLLDPDRSDETDLGKYKDEYLKKTSEKHLPMQMADTYIIPTVTVKDDKGNTQVVGDTKEGERLTQAISSLYNKGGFDNLRTNVINPDTNTPYTIGELMTLNAAKNDKGEVVKMPSRAPIFFTRLPGEKGVRQMVTTIGNTEIKIDTDQIEVPYNNQMTKLSEVTDSPLMQINNRILRAYNNGLRKIEAAKGITIEVPYDITEEGIRNGTFANNNELVVTVSSEDQKKYNMPSNYMGGDAIQYLMNKQKQGVINF